MKGRSGCGKPREDETTYFCRFGSDKPAKGPWMRGGGHRDVASRIARIPSRIALLVLLLGLEGSLWSQQTPATTNSSATPPAAASNEEDPRAAGEAPLVEREAEQPASLSTSSSTQRISEIQLSGLPLNGRSYNQLATLEAGVSDPSGGSASRGGGSGSLTVVGGRSTSNNFLLDGTNIMDSDNEVPRSAAGVPLGSDAVFEVPVFISHYFPQ